MSADRTAQIVSSDVFRYINLRIDEKAAELKAVLDDLPALVTLIAGPRERPYTPELRTRTSYEKGKEAVGFIRTPCSVSDLDRISFAIERCRQLEREIRELTRDKLRLLDDYDFTHGDNSEQIAVFGPSEGA